jgi:hypothetical protein
MANIQFQLKWSELSEKIVTSGFKSIRVSAECVPDIFIGINKDANRCLILSLPLKFSADVNDVAKENLSITYYREYNYIVLQLTDNDFYDLFDDLVYSMYHRIKDITDVGDYSREFVQTFFRWSEFFEDKRFNTLSEEIIKGVFGELLVLKSLINDSNASSLNEILNSWKGPFDQRHDFVLNSKNIEVKTKDIACVDVTISSEFQLEPEFERGLDLWVVNIQNDAISGSSIKDQVIIVRSIIASKLGDVSIFLRALMQKGLSMKNLDKYDLYKFKPINEVVYNCSAVGFPKIVSKDIPNEINSVRYCIRLSSLNPFITFQREF